MLDISKISKSVKIYGESLYSEGTVLGTITKGDYTLEEGNVLKIPVEGGHIYAKIRREVVEAGIDFDTKVFTIQEFVAKRAASGVSENGPWSVTEGQVKMFAY